MKIFSFTGRDTVRVNSFLEKAWDPDPQVIMHLYDPDPDPGLRVAFKCLNL